MQFQKTCKIKTVSEAPSAPLPWLKEKTKPHLKTPKNITNMSTGTSTKSNMGTAVEARQSGETTGSESWTL